MAPQQVAVEPRQGLFSFEDAAKVLGGISTWTLRAHVRQGNIRVVRLGMRIFLSPEELERVRVEGLPSLKPDKVFRQTVPEQVSGIEL
jgi:hypothetical protein